MGRGLLGCVVRATDVHPLVDLHLLVGGRSTALAATFSSYRKGPTLSARLARTRINTLEESRQRSARSASACPYGIEETLQFEKLLGLQSPMVLPSSLYQPAHILQCGIPPLSQCQSSLISPYMATFRIPDAPAFPDSSLGSHAVKMCPQ